jgi:hypothetical protein
MAEFLRWLERTPLSVWTRESTSFWAYPAILSAHAIGMGLAAGVSGALALCLLGALPGVPPPEMRRFRGVLWIGWWVNAVSGLLLLNAYPTKALTNPVFYVKMALIGVALGLFVAMDRRLERGVPGGRWLAAASLACWAAAITAGRLLAYTYHVILMD